MENLSRREFVKDTILVLFNFGRLTTLLIATYLTFLLAKNILNIPTEGWLSIGIVAGILLALSIASYFINKSINQYKAKHGDIAVANIAALSTSANALLIGLFSAMATRAFCQGSMDNVGMWSALGLLSLINLFRETKKARMPQQ